MQIALIAAYFVGMFISAPLLAAYYKSRSSLDRSESTVFAMMSALVWPIMLMLIGIYHFVNGVSDRITRY